MSENQPKGISDEEKWLDFFSSSISNLADFGEELYRVFFKLEEFKLSNILPAVNYFKNFVEIVDSISLNIKNGITTAPTRVLIRSAAEYYFSLMYLFSERDYLEIRSLSISYCSIIEEMKGFKPFFPENLKETERKLKLEFGQNPGFNFKKIDYSEKKRYFENLLGHKDFIELREEYLRTSNSSHFKNKRFIPWYSLWNGPRNVRDLAENTGELNIYKSIYDEFSHYTHGSKSFQKDFIHLGEDGSLHMYAKRTPYNLKFVSSPSFILCGKFYNRFIESFCGGDEKLSERLQQILIDFKEGEPTVEPINIEKNLVLRFPLK
ncbi:hypothetical protein SAMN04489724_3854 [Algoriphagus locisalis]|uniref:Uncharacterized protein n=1 Tax=Algoriphagus locisalis TaxID=305507 RepID=A0A1I7DB85_9BACT|nr:DUF5677 domain-containing protein [Algoriphagus locisalis]SFU08917.1 hypothetical protein SAMN04489724_3854 [Algoriphagus locisalis]